MTGVRREPGDRRRIRGAHAGLKRMLIEGMQVSSEKPYTWKDFSDALIRQSVGEAMHAMPPSDSELVKLAYFGGMSNRDLAARLRGTEADIGRRLRRALDRISEHVRRGRGMAERVLAGIGVWLGARWLHDHLPQGAPAGVVAAALIAFSQPVAVAPAPAQPAPPVGVAAGVTATAGATRAIPSSTTARGLVPQAAPGGVIVSVPSLPPAPVLAVPAVSVPPPVAPPAVTVPPVVGQVTTAGGGVTTTVTKTAGELG